MQKLGAPAPTHILKEEKKLVDLLAKKEATRKVFDSPRFLVIRPVFAVDVLSVDVSGTTVRREISICNISMQD